MRGRGGPPRGMPRGGPRGFRGGPMRGVGGGDRGGRFMPGPQGPGPHPVPALEPRSTPPASKNITTRNISNKITYYQTAPNQMYRMTCVCTFSCLLVPVVAIYLIPLCK